MDLSSLNPAQREAVEHGDGPLLVFAGAGSGKTRVLTYRLAYLLHSGRALPRQLLAVTFTNKAAGEMKRRVQSLIGDAARDVWVHTFHSACLRILRSDAHHIGIDRSFVIYDEGDQRAVLKQVLKKVDLSGRMNVGQLRALIEEAKRHRVPPDAYDGQPTIRVAYAEYQRILTSSNAVDFTDLLALTAKLFDDVPDVLDRYRDRFAYLLVDEFQDTDDLQYGLVKQLARPRNNLCAVGDDDQSIYSFRGADVGNIRGFAQDFPAARVVRLEQNYRSTTAILEAATRVVNTGGGGAESKRLWTDRGDGEPLTILQTRDEADEAHRVLQVVQREIRGGTPLANIAVLFRTNAQSRPLEEVFQRAGLPFVLVGGTRFYERREVKEALAYMRLLVQPADLVSFDRAVRAPSRGIGAGTVAKVAALVADRGLTAEDAIGELVAEKRVGPAMCKRLTGFRALVASLREEAPGLALPDLIGGVIERSGLGAAYLGDETFEGQQRYENLVELVRSAATRTSGAGLDALREFMDSTALVADADSLPDGAGTEMGETSGRISMMTIHCAKGLEFGVVCLVGLDEGLFPNSRAATSQRGLEEEYRLCYVGCTRAMDRLFLFRAQRRLMVFDRAGGAAGWRRTRPSPFLRYLRAPLSTALHSSPATVDSPDESVVVYDPAEVPIRVGTRVRHPTFGIGEVRHLSGHGPGLKLDVYFRQAGMKKISARHSKLEIVGR